MPIERKREFSKLFGKSPGLDFLEDGVAGAMVSRRNRSVAGRDGGPGVPFGNRHVAAGVVVGAIGRDLRDTHPRLDRAARAGFFSRPRQRGTGLLHRSGDDSAHGPRTLASSKQIVSLP